MATQEIVLKFRGDPSLLKGALNELKTAHASTMADVTRQQKVEAQSAIALQRQRSAAIITVWKADTRAANNEERERVRAAIALQRQRSAALVAQWKADQREQARIAREGQRTLASILGFGAGGNVLAGAAGGATALIGGSLVSQLQQGASAWVNYASKLESTKIAFTTMLGSAQRATAHLKELQAFALKTPFQFEELIDASQRMQALGFEAEQIVPVLTDVGNAVAAAGGGSERLDRVTLALSQMQSKGRVMTQELNQLAEAGIPAWRIMEQQLGKSRAELVKMVEAGEISSAVFLRAFQNFSQLNYGGLMEKQARTFTGAMSNMKDAALDLSSTALAPLFAHLTKGALEAGKFALSLKEGAQGAAILSGWLSKFPGLLDAIKLSAAFPGLLDAIRLGSQGLALLGTPEITAPSTPGVKPVPLPTGESQALTAAAEQVSALKAASEEAKRIARDRVADAERAFKLGKITREQETENIITHLRIQASAEENALNEEIIRKQKELLANKDNADKIAQIIETVGNLQQQIRNNQSALDRQIDDKRAELQLQERRNILEHEKAKLEILLSAGQARIQLIESEIRAGIKSAETGASEIEAIENAGLKARDAQLQNELAVAGKEPAERQKIIDAIERLDVERTSNTQKQADRRTEITKQANANDLALNEQLVSIRQAQREGELERIDQLLDVQAISESTAITHRLAILKEEQEDRNALLNIEVEQLTTTAERKLEIDNQKTESEIKYTNEVKRLTQERIDAANREAFQRSTAPGSPGATNQFLTDEEIAERAGAVANAQLGPPPEAIDAWVILKQASMDALNSMAQGIGDLVHQWVLYGTAGPNAVRKMLAAVLAAAAAQAAVEAIMQLAHAAKEYALGVAAASNPFTAAMAPGHFAAATAHTIAAAVYGAVAGVAAISGRAIAGNAFNQSTGGASDGGKSSGSRATSTPGEPKTVEIDRRSVAQPTTLTINLGLKDGIVADHFRQDYMLNGPTRLIIKTDGQG